MDRRETRREKGGTLTVAIPLGPRVAASGGLLSAPGGGDGSPKGAVSVASERGLLGGRLGRRRAMPGVVLEVIGVLALAVSLGLAAPRSSAGDPAPEQTVGIAAVVPGGRLGEYRHGTFPSRGNRTHVGVDIVAPCGTPVLALEAGRVVDRISSRRDPDFSSLGYMIIIEHPAAVTGQVFYSLYLHLQSPPVAGEEVVRGAALGGVGATGRATGCHLHLEVRYFPDRVSPRWQHIYGPGDQRASPHLRQSWEDPVAFIPRLERQRQTSRPGGPRQGTTAGAAGPS